MIKNGCFERHVIITFLSLNACYSFFHTLNVQATVTYFWKYPKSNHTECIVFLWGKYMSNRINPFGFKMWTQIRNNYHGATHTRRSRDVSSGLKRRQHKNDIIYTPLSEPLILEKPEIVEEVWTQTWSCIGTKSVVRTRYKFLLTSKFAYWRYIRYFNAVVTFAPSGLAMNLYEDTTWLTPISN